MTPVDLLSPKKEFNLLFDMLTIEHDYKVNLKFEAYDLQGRLCKKGTLEGEKLEVGSLKFGQYSLQFSKDVQQLLVK